MASRPRDGYVLWLILLAVACAIAGFLFVKPAGAKPAVYQVDQFSGDRYLSRVAQGASARDVTGSVRCPPPCARKPAKKRWKKPRRGKPGVVDPLTMRASQRSRSLPSKSLAGVVAPLAAKAREIEAACGSRVISAVRHTHIAGTGGRLSLHASGRAIDIAGNAPCIYSHLRNWPGGVSTDYGRVNHVHFSYNPGGAEWGRRFQHYRGGRHKRHTRRRA